MAGTLPLETFGSLASKKKLVSVNKILVYELQHSSEKAVFGKKKKKNEEAAQNCDSFAVECKQTISCKYGTENNMMCFYYLTHKK